MYLWTSKGQHTSRKSVKLHTEGSVYSSVTVIINIIIIHLVVGKLKIIKYSDKAKTLELLSVTSWNEKSVTKKLISYFIS